MIKQTAGIHFIHKSDKTIKWDLLFYDYLLCSMIKTDSVYACDK